MARAAVSDRAGPGPRPEIAQCTTCAASRTERRGSVLRWSSCSAQRATNASAGPARARSPMSGHGCSPRPGPGPTCAGWPAQPDGSPGARFHELVSRRTGHRPRPHPRGGSVCARTSPDAEPGVTTTRRTPPSLLVPGWPDDFCLCHGAAGAADVLSRGGRVRWLRRRLGCSGSSSSHPVRGRASRAGCRRADARPHSSGSQASPRSTCGWRIVACRVRC